MQITRILIVDDRKEDSLKKSIERTIINDKIPW